MAQVLLEENLLQNEFDPSVREYGSFSVTSRLRYSNPSAVFIVLLMLLAFAFRIHALERQSMWSDEGLSLYRASQTPSDLVGGLIVIDGVETRDTNPPLYFLLLHLWQELLGDKVLTLRYLGVLAGTLAVPLMYILGNAIYGRWVGLAAALLLSISPFHVWQSQLLRNYSLLLTLNLASIYGLFRFVLASPKLEQKRWLVLWVVAALLGIYTHYFGFLVFAFGAITVAAITVWRLGIRRLFRQKWFWIVAVLGLVILFPAVAISLDRFQAGRQVDFYHVPLSRVVVHAASAFGVGISPTLEHSWWRITPAIFLAIAGVLVGWRIRPRETVVLIGYQLIPLGFLLILSTINPLYNGVRHLLIGLPPFLIFVAAGAIGTPKVNKPLLHDGRVWQVIDWLRLLLFTVVILIQAGWLYTQFTDPDLLLDDIRGAAEYLNSYAEEDDLIILHDTIIGLTFDYYYDGAAPWRAIPTLGEHDVEAAKVALANAGMRANRIWFLTQPTPRTGFPRDVLWEWADANWPRFIRYEFPSMWLRVQLNGYIPEPTRETLPAQATVVDETFEGALRLHGVELPSNVKAGELWWATLYWSRLDPDAEDYTLSLRLVDEEGKIWGQDDDLLWQDFRPKKWPEKTIIRNDQEIALNSGIPPGEYGVILRVIDGDSEPLQGNSEEVDIFLGNIEVRAGTELSDLPPFSAQKLRLEDVDFLGYQLPDGGIRPGHEIPIELFWRVRQTPLDDFQLRVQLIDEAGDVISEQEMAPSRKDYPASKWQAGELLQSSMRLTMPASVQNAPYTVRVMLVNPEGGEMTASIALKETLTVESWPFVSEIPKELEPLNAIFGEPPSIALRGYDLPSHVLSAGDLLDFTLYWQAMADISEEYFVFIHLSSDDDLIAAQWDGAPAQGFRPTMSFRDGEVIKDDYAILIGSEVIPGNYRLWLGLYQPDTLERLAAKMDGQPLPDNRIFLGDITVEQAE